MVIKVMKSIRRGRIIISDKLLVCGSVARTLDTIFKSFSRVSLNYRKYSFFF